MLNSGDTVRIQVKMLPTSLESATERMMRPDSVAREEEVFGNEFVEHFGGTREHEVKIWNEAVTNWEGKLHLELCFMSKSFSYVPCSRAIS